MTADFNNFRWSGVTIYVERTTGGGGGGDFGVFGGAPHPPGGHAGSESDTLLPLTMTHDRRTSIQHCR